MIAFVMDINVISEHWIFHSKCSFFFFWTELYHLLCLQYQGTDENVDVEGFEEELEVDIV